jgi:hypothetical protein
MLIAYVRKTYQIGQVPAGVQTLRRLHRGQDTHPAPAPAPDQAGGRPGGCAVPDRSRAAWAVRYCCSGMLVVRAAAAR